MILNLADATGLPVALDTDACRLNLSPPLSAIEGTTRPAGTLASVYRDSAAARASAPEGLYFMYDGVALPEHQQAIARAGLRYDLTLLRDVTVGEEPVKTLGHYHTVAPDGLPYPELYQVVSGCAHFVLQRAFAPDYRVERVVVVEARAGETILMPPGWAHVSLNAGDEPLVMCNWIAEACGTVPAPYIENTGAACHEVRGDAGLEIVRNPRYDVVCPTAANRGIFSGSRLLPPGPVYTRGVAELDALRPLTAPATFDWDALPDA